MSMSAFDEDEDEIGFAYEDGHWVWDNTVNALQFISDRPEDDEEEVTVTSKVPTGIVEFRDNIDVLEQLRFRKKYARKLAAGEPDVITLQDVKDLAIYTAPVSLLSPRLINLMHLPTTERFMRALILYSQYYLQVSDEMQRRIKELQSTIRTPESDVIETEFRDNLCELRSLVAKEYTILLLGGSDTKKFHHMGPDKKSQSLSDKDARLFETLLRMCIQIVWLALSRRSFNMIEVEINRLFKSEIFNLAEHTLQTNYIKNLSKKEHEVLLGRYGHVDHSKKLTTRSPLMNETLRERAIDYRMSGLGIIKYKHLSPRMLYMRKALVDPEDTLVANGVSCGILGMPRTCFDTMLHNLPTPEVTSKSNYWSSKKSVAVGRSRTARSPSTKSGVSVDRDDPKRRTYIYNDINLPPREKDEPLIPPSFPDKLEAIRPCSDTQRRRWQARLYRLLHAPKRKTIISSVFLKK